MAYQCPYILKNVVDHKDTVFAHDHNKQEEQLDAITELLGCQPQGTYDTVQERLDNIKDDILSNLNPQDVKAGDTATPGTADTAARIDHKHAVGTAPTEEISITDAGDRDAGVSKNLARGDHKHQLLVGSPVEISDLSLNPGQSLAASRADHVHSHGARGGGTLHSLATQNLAGFMSPQDKKKLAGIAEGATNTPLSNENPSPVGLERRGVPEQLRRRLG